MKLIRGLSTTILLLGLLPGAASAHGFGNRYELSLPKWLFFIGGALTIIVSFILVSSFTKQERNSFSYASWQLTANPFRTVMLNVVVRVVRFCTVLLLGTSLLVGFVGPQQYNANMYTLLVWVGWWIGYTFSVIFIGNTWPVVNPWKTVYEWMVLFLGRDPSLQREYKWGAIPALVLLFGFGWIEIVSPFSSSPRTIAGLTLIYSVVTWLGMFLYGKEIWLKNGDPFTRLYRYLGKFAPLSLKRGCEIRLYGVRMVEQDNSLQEKGGLTFLILILYLVTFDGFLATPMWGYIVSFMPTLPLPYLTTTVLMGVGLMMFTSTYSEFAKWMKKATGTSWSDQFLARRFALSLLPIAIVYQVSHYYTFLLLQSQFFVLALADPFGFGWNLLSLDHFEPATSIPFLSIQVVWQSQVALIVLGHIVSVWIAHHIALDVFSDRRQAVKSQLPMLGLMIAYTMLSFWILTLPVVDPPLP